MAEMVEALLFSGSREMWMLLDRWCQFQQHWAWILALATAAGGAFLMQRRKITVGLSCVEVSVESSFSGSAPSAAVASPIQELRTIPQSQLASPARDVALKPKMFYSFHGDSVSEWEPESDPPEQLAEDSSLKGSRYEDDESSGWSLPSVPEWAWSLFQPVPLPGLYSTSQTRSPCATVAGHPGEEWDSIMDMYSEMGSVPDWKEMAKSLFSTTRRLRSPGVVFRGPKYLAKAKEEVVKLWGSSRRMMRTWYLAEEEGHVSALDVDERWNSVTAGTTNGYLSLWDITSSERLRSQKPLANGSVSCVKVNPEYMRVISAGNSASDSCVEVWDPRRTRRRVDRLEAKDNVLNMECLDNQVYVREGWKVRGYDLRKLAKWFDEEEVTEQWWDADQGEEAVKDEEADEDEDADDGDDWDWIEETAGDDSPTGGKSFLSKCLGALWS